MRALGLNATSAGAIRIVRRHAVRLGLDTSHFRGKRSWSDAQLRRAVIDAQSWDDLLTTLGLSPHSGDGRIRVKTHAMRLGLGLAHLEDPTGKSPGPAEVKPDLRYLRDAATSIAASWFSLCGLNVAIPVEPAVYDLLVSMPEGIKRVQVKTTTCYSKDGWAVVVSRRPYSAGNRERRVPYDPELIDWFFIVDDTPGAVRRALDELVRPGQSRPYSDPHDMHPYHLLRGRRGRDSGEDLRRILNQGYVAVDGENVLFPSIAVNRAGFGVMAFTLSGPDFFPSAAYARFASGRPAGPIHITGAGALPEDGSSGYKAFQSPTPGVARWGDYSAAVFGDGAIWMGNEYIPNALLAN